MFLTEKDGRSVTGRFFTLIELLVVIAIIAILAAMLMPALETARAKARVIADANKERQVFLGVFFYTQEYSNYPSGQWIECGPPEQHSFWAQYRWHEPVIKGGFIQEKWNDYPEGSVLRSVWDEKSGRNADMWWRLSGVQYGCTGSGFNPVTGVSGHSDSSITHSSQTFLLMMGSSGTSWENGWDANYPHAWDPAQTKAGTQGGGNNIAFCDGHREFWTKDWRDDIEGLQPFPSYQYLGNPDYFYGCNGSGEYVAQWWPESIRYPHP